MKTQLFVLAALLVGTLLALQGVLNSQLGKLLAHPLHASYVSFFVGILSLVALLMVSGIGFPSATTLYNKAPWYLYIGGLLGVVYVSTVLILMPKIGAANVLSSIFVGQILFSLVIDHFALFGMPLKPLDLTRAGGCGMLLAGLYLVQR